MRRDALAAQRWRSRRASTSGRSFRGSLPTWATHEQLVRDIDAFLVFKRALGYNGDYTYMPIVPNKIRLSYNVEERAEMISDRFLLRHGFPANNQFGNGAATSSTFNMVPGILPEL